MDSKEIQYGSFDKYKPFSENPELSEAIKQWIDQGRDSETVHGVLNFFTGKGLPWAALPPQPSPKRAEGDDARTYQEGYKDALEDIKAIKHLPLLTAKEYLEDISNHIEDKLSELDNTKGREDN